MGYHPETLAFSFPPTSARVKWRWLYTVKNFIGFDIWHIDPEKRVKGQRRDDSCGWFDRRPGADYAPAVKEILADEGDMQAIRNAMARAVHQAAGYSPRGWRRMTPADCLAACLMVAQRLEHLRLWRLRRDHPWRPRWSRYAATMKLATNLALNEVDNLQTSDDAESFVVSIASALNRRFRPWYRHPRWHVHHWQVKFDLVHNLRRFFARCVICKKRFGWRPCVFKDSRGLHCEKCHDDSAKVRAGERAAYPH